MIKPPQILKSLFIVSLAAFLLSSCSKKDNETPSQMIVGNWTISSQSVNATVNGMSLTDYFVSLGATQSQADSASQYFTSSFPAGNSNSSIEFKSDGTATLTESGTTSSGTWSLSSDGTKLTLNEANQGSAVFDVLTLNSHNLDIQFSSDDMEDLNGDGTPEDIKITWEIKATK